MRVLFKTGSLVIEAPGERDLEKVGTRNVEGYVAAFEEHGFDYELLDPAELTRRWPQFRLEGSERVIFQKDSGLVDARKANPVHITLARARGATVLEETPVRAIRLSGESVEVVTDGRTYLTSRVVVASDAWTTEVLGKAGTRIPLTVTQEQVTYYATPNLRQFSPERFPVVMWHGADNFYGFPVYGEVATKLGHHMGGHEVTAKTRTFEPDPGRLERYRGFLGRHIPGFLGPEIYTKTCLYTIPPDQNFIMDTLPEHPPGLGRYRGGPRLQVRRPYWPHPLGAGPERGVPLPYRGIPTGSAGDVRCRLRANLTRVRRRRQWTT